MAQLLEVLKNSWGHSRMLERNGAILAKDQEPSRLHESGAPLRLLAKDMGIIAGAAEGLELDLEVASSATHALDAAMDKGLQEADQAVIFYLMQDGTIPAPRVIKPLVRSMPVIHKGHDFDKQLGLREEPKHSPFPGPKDQAPTEFSIPVHRWQR